MKKMYFSFLFVFAVCLGFGCGNDGGNTNLSTPTEKVGSGEGDELMTESPDGHEHDDTTHTVH